MKLSEQMRAKRDETKRERDALHDKMSAILDKAGARSDKKVLASEDREFQRLKRDRDRLSIEVDEYQERYEELLGDETREGNAAQHRAQYGGGGGGEQRYHTSGGNTYRPDGDHSFFADLISARRGDHQAAERLARNNAESGFERRAGDMTTVAGAGGEFAPPMWAVEQYVTLARPGRVTADLTTKDVLPPGHSSINLPAVSTGTTTAVQATQNSALSDTAMTTTSVSSGITTVGGKQIVSLQLLTQSPGAFDQVIFKDLAADHAERIDLQVLYGSNANGQVAGISGVSGINTVTYTSAAPLVTSATNAASFLFQIISAKNKVENGIFRSPTAVVMHTRRWNWCLNALDTANRPLIVPQGQQFNSPAISNEPRAEGAVGVIAGLDVYTDPNISTTANSATNQDECYVLKADELFLYESPLRAEAFEATYADNASVLLRLLNFVSFIPHRRPKAISVIRGTGMIDPGL